MKYEKSVPEVYYLQAEFCKTIAQPKRLIILETLERGPKTISELSKELGFSPPNIAQHIKALYEKGIIERVRESNFVYYKLKYPEVLEASKIVREVMLKIYSERGKILVEKGV